MYTHFKLEEFACKCGCGENLINAELVSMLDDARDIAGVPFIVNSGYRCVKHNKNIGGVPDSAHTKGFACDIHIEDGWSRFLIIKSLISVGFERIGVYKNFVHCDIDRTKPKGIWYGK